MSGDSGLDTDGFGFEMSNLESEMDELRKMDETDGDNEDGMDMDGTILGMFLDTDLKNPRQHRLRFLQFLI